MTAEVLLRERAEEIRTAQTKGTPTVYHTRRCRHLQRSTGDYARSVRYVEYHDLDLCQRCRELMEEGEE